jgi:hypothetical protein
MDPLAAVRSSGARRRGAWSVVLALLLGSAAASLAALPADAAATDGQATSRIVGGRAVGPGVAPFQVALLRRATADELQAQFCGGTIVDATHVVTAAHCVYEESKPGAPLATTNSILVLAGATRLRAPADPPHPAGARTVAVRAITPHPLYRPRPDWFAFDVAVIETASPLYEGDPRSGSGATIAPLPLATADPAAGSPITHYGWGDVLQHDGGDEDEESAFPRDLQMVTTAVVDRAACAASNPSFSSVNQCAGAPRGGVGTCSGDSGGPGVVGGPAGPVLTGIVSFGRGCGAAGAPGIDTRVAHPLIGDFVRTVLAGGTYVPPPGSDDAGEPEGDGTDGSPTIVSFGTWLRANRDGTVVGRYKLDEPGRERHVLYLNGVRVSGGRIAQTGAGWFRMTFHLSARGKRILRRSRARHHRMTATWRVTAWDPAGNRTVQSRGWRFRF